MTTSLYSCEKIKLTPHQFETIATQKGACFLDGQDASPAVSVVACDPITILKHINGNLLVERNEQQEWHHSDPFKAVQSHVKKAPSQALSWCDFSTGYIGVFSYEAARYFFDYAHLSKKSAYPDMLGGIYDRFIAINHQTNDYIFVSSSLYGRDTLTFDVWYSQLTKSCLEKHASKSIEMHIQATPKKTYDQTLTKILDYIKNGDCYQVNYSTPFNTSYPDHPYRLYKQLKESSPAPYSAYLNFGAYHILSSSPELFFSKKGRCITTKPIKGTIKRGRSACEDKQLKSDLLSSKKDQAELTMIIDLERNDLNKICKINTVKVKKYRYIESFKHVHHGVAEISGILKSNVQFIDIMNALFPGGSITGAPKIRAMEIIAESEPAPRGPYTGAIGYVSGSGNMMFNIAIRTLYTNKESVCFHAGSGIVSDSQHQSEWDECLVKVKGIMQIMNA